MDRLSPLRKSDRHKTTRDRRQEMGDKRWEAKEGRQKMGDERQEMGDNSWERKNKKGKEIIKNVKKKGERKYKK